MAATSLFFTSFLILGQSSLALPEDDELGEPRRWNGDNDSETVRVRDFGGGDREAAASLSGAGIDGRGMLISVYSGLSSSSVFGVLTVEVEESRSQHGSTCGVTTPQHMFSVPITLGITMSKR